MYGVLIPVSTSRYYNIQWERSPNRPKDRSFGQSECYYYYSLHIVCPAYGAVFRVGGEGLRGTQSKGFIQCFLQGYLLRTYFVDGTGRGYTFCA